jgi:protein-disulfide isomerase
VNLLDNHISEFRVYQCRINRIGVRIRALQTQGEFCVKPLPISRIGIFLFVVAIVLMTAALSHAQTNTSTNAVPKSAASTPGSTKPAAKKAPASLAAKPASAVTGSIDAKALGSKNAPITIEVFEDFQCPACRNFYETSLKQVIDNYVTPGKVYLIHRDFPLDMHPYSHQAARLANAAADLGQFETVERALFDNQDKWSANGKIEEAIASTVSPTQMKKILDYQAAHINDINASIERDRAMGAQRNVSQTPSIYVTSRGKTEALPGGGVDYKLLKQYLDYLLRQ